MAQQQQVLNDATVNLQRKEQALATATENVNNAVRNDPFIADFLQGKSDVLDIFSDGPERAQITNLLGNDLYEVYKKFGIRIKQTLKAIPNEPISPEAKKAFIEKVKAITSDASIVDTSGGKTRKILGSIADRLKLKTTNVEMDESMMLDGAVTYSGTQIQTVEQLAQEIGNIGFKDLYDLRKELTRLIDGEQNNPAVRDRLIELKNHITDGEDGQLAFLKNSDNEEIANLAENADSFFIEAKSRLESTEPLRLLSDKFKTMRYREKRQRFPKIYPTHKFGGKET